jgi:glycosyltransferase involved in cell wall biosynthesis
VLWCGGYNVWTDIETLFKALSRAMDFDPRIVFVSAGAGVKIAQNNSYERLLQMIASSPHQQRFHMLGWQPYHEVQGLYPQADVGVNLDAWHYETFLGTRTRLVEMMQYGLPVITTLGCELSQIIQSHSLGLTFSIGDSDTFCEHILTLAREKRRLQKCSKQAQEYATHHLSFEVTTQPFLKWVNQPSFAPDRISSASKLDIREIEYTCRYWVRSILWKLWGLEKGE